MLSVTFVGVVAFSACTLGGADKSGGEGPVTTLKLATSDQSDSRMSVTFERFAAEVDSASHGRLRVRTTYAAGVGTDVLKFDQVVAGLVQDGSYDLAMVPARSWDDLGVSTLRPLQTPFLVDSDELLDDVVTSDLAGPLMAGLPAAGVHGLGLWPEALRHPVGYGHPLLALEDFAGARIRAPYSRDVYALLTALGSAPVDLAAAAMNAAYADGRLQGAESGFNQSAFGAPSTITADVTLYAKIDTIVINTSVWDALEDDERTALASAVAATRDWLVDNRPDDDETLSEACTIGFGVALAGDPALEEMRRATRPLTQQLRSDPELGPLVEEIEALKADIVPDPFDPPTCSLADEQEDIGPRIDPAVLDGTYRTSFTPDELVAAGEAPDMAVKNSGFWTITLDGGRYVDVESQDCVASYEVSRRMIAFKWDPDVACSGDWTARWELTRDGLRFIDVQSPFAGDRAVWGLHEWERID